MKPPDSQMPISGGEF